MRLVEGVLKRGLGPGSLSNGNIRLITEMFLGMLRSIVLYRGSRDTPEALARQVVRLFLDGFRGCAEQREHPSPRPVIGGKAHERAAALL